MSTDTTPAVTWDRVTKDYRKGRDTVRALHDMSLRVDRGRLFGLLGPNGAGKSTSLEIAVGLRRATTGTVRCLGLDPAADRDQVTRRVGIQPQEVRLFEFLSVRELLDTWASFHEAPLSVDDLVEELAMGSYADRRVRTLSGGQRQRLHIALAMVGRPELLVLDEPSAGLDPQVRRDLWDLLRRTREAGTSVIVSTHSMEEAEELCDEVAIVDAGRCVAHGTPTGLIADSGAANRIAFSVTPESREVVEQKAAALGAVSSMAGRVVLETTDSDRAIAQLAGVGGVRDLSVERPSLRDVYFAQTGKTYDHTDDTTGAAR